MTSYLNPSKYLIAFLALLFCAIAGQEGRANFITGLSQPMQFTQTSGTLSPAPYAYLDIQIGAGADVGNVKFVVTANTADFPNAKFEGFGFNTNALVYGTDFTVTSNPFKATQSIDTSGSGVHFNGQGDFQVGVHGGNSNADRLSSFEVIVLLTNAANATVANFEGTSTGGAFGQSPAYFATHFYDGRGSNGGNVFTGDIGVAGLTPTTNIANHPAPTSAMLVATGLFAMLGWTGYSRLRRRQLAAI